MLHKTIFFLHLATQQHCLASFKNNCPCNTLFLQFAMQQNVSLQAARKVELSSTFRNIARQVAACNMSSCKFQENLPYTTWPLVLTFMLLPTGMTKEDLLEMQRIMRERQQEEYKKKAGFQPDETKGVRYQTIN